MTINSTDYFEGLRDNANAFRTHAGDVLNSRDLRSHRRRKNTTNHKRQRRPAEQYPLAEQYERSALPPPQIDHLHMLNDAPYHDALVAYRNLQRLEASFSKSRQSPSMNGNRSYNDDHTNHPNHRNNGATFSSSPVLGDNTATDATAVQDHQVASQPDAWHGTSNVEALLLRELEELDKQLDIIRSPDKEVRSPSSATHTPNTPTMAEQENEDWEEYSDDEGYVYYYNPVTGESQWDEPTMGSPDQKVEESKDSGGGGDEDGRGDDEDKNEGSGGSPKGLTKAQQKLWMMTLNPRQQDLFYQTLHPELHQKNSNDDVNDDEFNNATFWDKVSKHQLNHSDSIVSHAVVGDVNEEQHEDSKQQQGDPDIGLHQEKKNVALVGQQQSNGRKMTMPGAPPRMVHLAVGKFLKLADETKMNDPIYREKLEHASRIFFHKADHDGKCVDGVVFHGRTSGPMFCVLSSIVVFCCS